jgi:RNA polymerase sigma factor (sigma-70 family)
LRFITPGAYLFGLQPHCDNERLRPARLASAGGSVEEPETGWLVTAAAGGDPAAWRALVHRFSGLIWSIARAHRLSDADAADVTQTTWLRLAEHIGKLNAPDRVGAWLATAARRECLAQLRAGHRVIVSEDMAAFESLPDGDNPTEDEVLAAESEREDAHRAEVLWQAVGQLPDRCRELIRVLMASPPPSYAEVAAALGLPVGSIGPTRARCLQRLRDAVRDRI